METDLLKDIKKGSKASFDKLFEDYYNDMFSYALMFTKDEALSEEIVLDVFTHLWINRKKLIIRNNIKAYLLKAVKNKSISYLRKKSIDFYDGEFSDIYSNDCNPEKKIIADEEKKQLLEILEIIPPRSREVFVLHRLDGLKYQEIADLLGISKNTVENHIVKALKILRDNYKKN